MKNAIIRLLSLTAAMAMAVTSAMAIGGPPPGGGGGQGSAGQEFGTFDEVRSSAAIVIENGQVSGDIPSDGTVSFTGISGVQLETGPMGNGVAITMADESNEFTVGGTGSSYTVDGKSYDTVIRAHAGSGNDDLGYEAAYGVALGISTGRLRIENSYISSDGPRSTPVYAFSTKSPGTTSLVVVNSHLQSHSDSVWMPPFKLLAGGARATLLMTRSHSWFYGSEVISNNWGAISQDSVDAMTYVVNSMGASTQGGYGTYLTYGMRLYGSQLYAGQYGVFMCGTSDFVADNGSAALDDQYAMVMAPDFVVDSQQRSVVAAPFNALVVHNSLPSIADVARIELRDVLVSTDPGDLADIVTPMSYKDDFFMPGVNIIGSGQGCGASYFFNKNLYGSLALIRSMNAELIFNGAETRTSNGVLIHSVITYDPPSASGYLTPQQSTTVPGITARLEKGDYAGDILHQDYQRPMTVTIGSDASLTGRAVSGTYAGWNALWSQDSLTAALESDGYEPDFFANPQWVEDVQANLIRSTDTVYSSTDNLGIAMTVQGQWTVTDTSSLSTLVLEDSGRILAPENYELEYYLGCNSSNDLEFYDESGLEPLSQLEPGTYNDLVIKLKELPEPAPQPSADPVQDIPDQPSPEPSPEPSPTQDTQDTQQVRTSPMPIIAAVVVISLILFIIRRFKGKK